METSDELKSFATSFSWWYQAIMNSSCKPALAGFPAASKKSG